MIVVVVHFPFYRKKGTTQVKSFNKSHSQKSNAEGIMGTWPRRKHPFRTVTLVESVPCNNFLESIKGLQLQGKG